MGIYDIASFGALLSGNSYPGRGIAVGLTPNGKSAVSAYFIMGRSANSRNRVFRKTDDNTLITAPYDESKVEDPSLIIYNAVRKLGNCLIVTNGDQTDTIYEGMKAGKSFSDSLLCREFEPDEPNFTPRISALLCFEGGYSYDMSILKSLDSEGTACSRYHWAFPAKAGLGHFIHTYNGDGSPIPTFTGEPERIAMFDDIDVFTEEIWKNLNEANKISLYVRYTDLATGIFTERIINKNC